MYLLSPINQTLCKIDLNLFWLWRRNRTSLQSGMRAKYSYTHFIMYKPYSPEWHRYRYLKEAIDTYFDDYVDNEVIYEDLMHILSSRMSSAVEEVNKVMDLKDKLKHN